MPDRISMDRGGLLADEHSGRRSQDSLRCCHPGPFVDLSAKPSHEHAAFAGDLGVEAQLHSKIRNRWEADIFIIVQSRDDEASMTTPFDKRGLQQGQ